jgi:hypothetical protein
MLALNLDPPDFCLLSSERGCEDMFLSTILCLSHLGRSFTFFLQWPSAPSFLLNMLMSVLDCVNLRRATSQLLKIISR